ncbi:MAG: hypothetical protein ABIT05_05140 [Chitinophagaceae bacterium]
MNEKSFNIKFEAIELVSKSISEPPNDLQGQEGFTFNFLIDLKAAPDQKRAIVLTEASIIRLNGMKELAKFKILCVFEVDNFDILFTEKTDQGVKKYESPVELEVILKSAGLSTIRGIIASEVKGTYLQGAVLPFVDVNTLVRDKRKEISETKS